MVSEVCRTRFVDHRLHPLMLANAILARGALRTSARECKHRNPSWGTMISDGIRLIPSAIHLTSWPGTMLV